MNSSLYSVQPKTKSGHSLDRLYYHQNGEVQFGHCLCLLAPYLKNEPKSSRRENLVMIVKPSNLGRMLPRYWP